MLLFLWRSLSWVLGSWMQLKPQGLPVLSGNTAPVAFLTVRDDLATGQAGCCPGPDVMLPQLSGSSGASSSRGHSDTMAAMAGAHGTGCLKQDGDAPGVWPWLCAAAFPQGKWFIFCPSCLSPLSFWWGSVSLETLATWIFAIWWFKALWETQKINL